MTVREQVQQLLENSRENYLSGEEIAWKLGVTRAAVWKAVQALEKDGYAVDAVPNRGYRFSGDTLSAAGVEKLLSPENAGLRMEVFREVSSTNALLRERALAGAPEGTVIVADAQTAGRGRFGRVFFSPSGTGLYLSVLLRPAIPAALAARITTAAAVAVCEAVEAVSGKAAGIKWVNDVLLSGKKICGILTEAAFDMESGSVEYAVLGVGINVYAPEGGFPEELAGIAGAVLDTRTRGAKNALAAAFLNSFFRLYRELEQGTFLAAYRARCLVLGRRIRVLSAAGETPATAIDVDGDCHLVVRYDDGSTAALSSGEISVRLS